MVIPDTDNAPQGFAALAYLCAVGWAIVESNRRWKTILWIVISLAATLGVFFAMSLVWPDLAGVFGHVAAVVCLLVSALVGINYMRAHRRAATPKS